MIPVQICIFAYNLEKEILRNLNSVLAESNDYDCQLYVMINGCSDKTYDVVKKYSRDHSNVHPVKIEIGDKSNAWNEFVHKHYIKGSIGVFLDGDLTFCESAINNIIDYQQQHPKLNSVSSFPWEGGRSNQQWRKELLEKHQFTGNLYVLSTDFLCRVIDSNIKLPIGLIGDDSMLGYLCATDLCGIGDYPHERIGVCQNAVFYYPKLNPFKPSDIKLYLRRRVRYAMREIQQSAIVPKLKEQGITAMPVYANTAVLDYQLYKSKGLVNYYFAKIAIKEMKKKPY